MSDLTAQHRSAGQTVITSGLVMNERGQFLALLRADNKSDGGTWGMPGGKKLPRELESEGAMREVFEETGLRTRIVTSLGVSDKGGKLFIDFLVYAQNSDSVVLNDEHLDHKWVALNDWPRPAHPVTQKILTQQAERIRRFADALKPTTNPQTFDL